MHLLEEQKNQKRASSLKLGRLLSACDCCPGTDLATGLALEQELLLEVGRVFTNNL